MGFMCVLMRWKCVNCGIDSIWETASGIENRRKHIYKYPEYAFPFWHTQTGGVCLVCCMFVTPLYGEPICRYTYLWVSIYISQCVPSSCVGRWGWGFALRRTKKTIECGQREGVDRWNCSMCMIYKSKRASSSSSSIPNTIVRRTALCIFVCSMHEILSAPEGGEGTLIYIVIK